MKSVYHIDGSIYNNDISNLKIVEQENLEDLDAVLSVRCHYCARKISLMTCEFDSYENPCCAGGC